MRYNFYIIDSRTKQIIYNIANLRLICSSNFFFDQTPMRFAIVIQLILAVVSTN